MKKELARAAVILCGAVICGCNGWPHSNDAKQAEYKAEKYHTYSPTAASQAQIIEFENRRYVVTPAPVDLHEAQMQAVGMAGSVSVYAPKGEAAPYSALYTPVGGTTWRRVQPIE